MQLTDSGTTALSLAMLASGSEGARARIALPAWGCYDLMTAADVVDAEVILYDLDPCTLAPDAVSFRSALRLGPGAVVIAHWFGLPVSLAPLLAMAREAGAVVLEDAAQAVGGNAGGRPLGTQGDFAVLSFGRGKGRTGGRGGALLANSPSAAERTRRVAGQLRDAPSEKAPLLSLAAQWATGRPSLYGIPASIPQLRLGETVYHAPRPIRRLPAWAAAVVGALWDPSGNECRHRHSMGRHWAGVVARSRGIHGFRAPEGSEAGWLRYPVLVSERTALLDDRARRLGIMPGYPASLSDLPVARGRFVGPSGSWPGADALATRLRTLPTHSLLTASDVAAITALLEGLQG